MGEGAFLDGSWRALGRRAKEKDIFSRGRAKEVLVPTGSGFRFGGKGDKSTR